MDAVTYPDQKVIKFFEDNLAPVRVLITSKPLPQQYKVSWTPTFVSLDSEGVDHHRTVGFLPPDEMIPSLILGIAKTFFDLPALFAGIRSLCGCLAGLATDPIKSRVIPLRNVVRGRSPGPEQTADGRGGGAWLP